MASDVFKPDRSMKKLIAGATPRINDAMEKAVRAAGIPVEVALELFGDPRLAGRMKREVERRLSDHIFVIWDALFAKALAGDVGAMKLYMERFDSEYLRRVKAANSSGDGFNDDELPTYDEFHRMMVARFGEDSWTAACLMAKKKGFQAGVFGEERLPGGSAEDLPDEEIEEEFVDLDPEDLFRELDEGPG